MSVSIAGDGTLTGVDAALSGFGKVLQVVQTVKTDTFTTSSTSFTAVTGMSVSITPSSASNKVLVVVQTMLGGMTGNGSHLRITRGGTAIYVGDAASNRIQGLFGLYALGDESYRSDSVVGVYLDSPATTSATTYGLELRSYTANASYINRSTTDSDNAAGSRGASSITAIEVAA